MKGLVLCLLVLGLIAAGPAVAHDRSQSASSWHATGHELIGEFSVDRRRATVLLGEGESDIDAVLDRQLAYAVHARLNDQPCALGPVETLPATSGYMRRALRFDCGGPITDGQLELDIAAFFAVSVTHSHIASIAVEGAGPEQWLLTSTRHVIEVGEATHFAQFLSFLTEGTRHVLSGLDHVAFLLALFLAAGRARRVLITATGFTLGHSVSMALVALGQLSPQVLSVEVLIGFSIAVAAMEAVHRWEPDPRAMQDLWLALGAAGALLAGMGVLAGQGWLVPLSLLCVAGFAVSRAYSAAEERLVPFAIASVFGLVHGAGFGGALLGHGLEGSDILTALLGFNLGVEVGQIVLLAVAWLVAMAILKLPNQTVRVSATGLSAALLALGLAWTAMRVLGG